MMMTTTIPLRNRGEAIRDFPVISVSCNVIALASNLFPPCYFAQLPGETPVFPRLSATAMPVIFVHYQGGFRSIAASHPLLFALEFSRATS